jgi:hypothetical protein
MLFDMMKDAEQKAGVEAPTPEHLNQHLTAAPDWL